MAKKVVTGGEDRHKPRKMVPVPLDLYEAIAELAKKNSRPVSWEIRLAIEDRLKAAAKESSDG
jgi:predicted DNA-binding protein